MIIINSQHTIFVLLKIWHLYKVINIKLLKYLNTLKLGFWCHAVTYIGDKSIHNKNNISLRNSIK